MVFIHLQKLKGSIAQTMFYEHSNISEFDYHSLIYYKIIKLCLQDLFYLGHSSLAHVS